MRGGEIADWIEMDCGQGRGKLDNLGFFQEKGVGGERIFRYATGCRCGFSIDAALCRLRTSEYADGEISGFTVQKMQIYKQGSSDMQNYAGRGNLLLGSSMQIGE